MKTSFSIVLAFLASTSVDVLARLGSDKMPSTSSSRRLPHFITWDSTLYWTCDTRFMLFGDGKEQIKLRVDDNCETSGFVKMGDWRGPPGRMMLEEEEEEMSDQQEHRRLEDMIVTFKGKLEYATLYEARDINGGRGVVRAFDGVVEGIEIVVVQIQNDQGRRRLLEEEGDHHHRHLEDAMPFTIYLYSGAYLGFTDDREPKLAIMKSGTREQRDAGDFDQEFQAREV